jgi:hypothetical protein
MIDRKMTDFYLLRREVFQVPVNIHHTLLAILQQKKNTLLNDFSSSELERNPYRLTSQVYKHDL